MLFRFSAFKAKKLSAVIAATVQLYYDNIRLLQFGQSQESAIQNFSKNKICTFLTMNIVFLFVLEKITSCVFSCVTKYCAVKSTQENQCSSCIVHGVFCSVKVAKNWRNLCSVLLCNKQAVMTYIDGEILVLNNNFK